MMNPSSGIFYRIVVGVVLCVSLTACGSESPTMTPDGTFVGQANHGSERAVRLQKRHDGKTVRFALYVKRANQAEALYSSSSLRLKYDQSRGGLRFVAPTNAGPKCSVDSLGGGLEYVGNCSHGRLAWDPGMDSVFIETYSDAYTDLAASRATATPTDSVPNTSDAYGVFPIDSDSLGQTTTGVGAVIRHDGSIAGAVFVEDDKATSVDVTYNADSTINSMSIIVATSAGDTIRAMMYGDETCIFGSDTDPCVVLPPAVDAGFAQVDCSELSLKAAFSVVLSAGAGMSMVSGIGKLKRLLTGGGAAHSAARAALGGGYISRQTLVGAGTGAALLGTTSFGAALNYQYDKWYDLWYYCS